MRAGARGELRQQAGSECEARFGSQGCDAAWGGWSTADTVPARLPACSMTEAASTLQNAMPAGKPAQRSALLA